MKNQTIAQSNKNVNYLLIANNFNATGSREQFFSEDPAVIGLYTFTLDGLGDSNYPNSFYSQLTPDDIKTYHLQAHGHLHKSRKSDNWHLHCSGRPSEAELLQRCAVRTRQMLIQCAKKIYNMLTARRVYDLEDPQHIYLPNASEDYKTALQNLAETVDAYVDAQLISAWLDDDNDDAIIYARDCIPYLYQK